MEAGQNRNTALIGIEYFTLAFSCNQPTSHLLFGKKEINFIKITVVINVDKAIKGILIAAVSKCGLIRL